MVAACHWPNTQVPGSCAIAAAEIVNDAIATHIRNDFSWIPSRKLTQAERGARNRDPETGEP